MTRIRIRNRNRQVMMHIWGSKSVKKILRIRNTANKPWIPIEVICATCGCQAVWSIFLLKSRQSTLISSFFLFPPEHTYTISQSPHLAQPAHLNNQCLKRAYKTVFKNHLILIRVKYSQAKRRNFTFWNPRTWGERDFVNFIWCPTSLLKNCFTQLRKLAWWLG